MARRTLEVMVGSVQRKLGAFTVGLGEIVDALAVANKELHSKWDWPWVRTETLISVPANYSIGTADFVDGSSMVTGTGTTWDTAWTNKRILMGPSSIPYRVLRVLSPTSLQLVDAPNTTQAGVGYTIFQDTYDLPADFEPGTDLRLLNNQLRDIIPHVPAISLYEQGLVMLQFFTTVATGYCDAGYNATTRRYQFQIVPPPGGVQQYLLKYKRMPPDLTTPGQYSEIPESFDDILEWMATSSIALQYGLGVQKGANANAVQKAKDLKRRIAMTPVENSARNHGTGWGDGSMTQGGLTLLPR